jgi:tRNA-dihydrouridine synthase B
MFKYFLAPLEDYTGSAMRKLCFDNGADLTFSEMTRVEGIVRNNKATLSKIKIKDNTPVQIQLLSSNEEQLKKYIDSFVTFDGFCGFNLNLCCPSKNIVKFGRGSAMVKRVEKTDNLVKIIQKENYPVSIKLSLGLNNFEKENKVYLQNILETTADFYIVQTKTASQKSSEEYDYSILGECVDTGKKIIANGEINTAFKVNQMKKIGCGGVMIGRSAILNPAIFNELKGKKTKSFEILTGEYKLLCEKYGEKEKYFDNFLKAKQTSTFY